MYIKNATIAVIFRVIFIIVCGAGLVVKLMDSGTGPDVLLGDFAQCTVADIFRISGHSKTRI